MHDCIDGTGLLPLVHQAHRDFIPKVETLFLLLIFFFAIKVQCGWFSPSPDRDPESLTRWRLLVLNAHGKAHRTTVTLCKFALQQLCEQWLCEPSSDSWPWHLVWHVRVLSGPCCPCWVLLPPALASSCRTGCWGHRWISLCLLAPSAAARTQWEMRKASPPSC